MTDRTLDDVAKAAAAFAGARVERDNAIWKARAAGHSLRKIATTAGLAHETVAKICRER